MTKGDPPSKTRRTRRKLTSNDLGRDECVLRISLVSLQPSGRIITQGRLWLLVRPCSSPFKIKAIATRLFFSKTDKHCSSSSKLDLHSRMSNVAASEKAPKYRLTPHSLPFSDRDVALYGVLLFGSNRGHFLTTAVTLTLI